MQFSTPSHDLIPPRSKYPPQPGSQTPSVYIFSLMSETKFHTHTETKAKLYLVYSNFKFFNSKWEDRRFWTGRWQVLPEFSLLLISSWIKFRFVTVVTKYLNCDHFQTICLLFLCIEFDLHSGVEPFITSLLASIQVSVFFFIVSMLSPSRFTSSALSQKLMYPIQFQFHPVSLDLPNGIF
jgi:hypothetical protein